MNTPINPSLVLKNHPSMRVIYQIWSLGFLLCGILCLALYTSFSQSFWFGIAALALAVLIAFWGECRCHYIVVPKRPSRGKTYWIVLDGVVAPAPPGRYPLSEERIFCLEPSMTMMRDVVFLRGVYQFKYAVCFKGPLDLAAAQEFFRWQMNPEWNTVAFGVYLSASFSVSWPYPRCVSASCEERHCS